jgi:bifunctional non-homologous end joining protein LigD
METPTVDFLPAHLQPGKIVTMQPTDARQPREFYITHEAYWGQPKIDGNRLVVIATEGARYYQSRSLQLRSAPSLEIEGALQALAVEFGTTVLDGELVYYDAADAEHRTGAQAATANIEMGRGDVQPRPVYQVFRSLYSNGGDRTGDPESLRIQEAEDLLAWLDGSGWQGPVRMLPTARTTDQKRELAESQEASGREGEVWTLHAGRYLGGKDAKSERTVRTKYLVDLEVVILHLTPTTAEGRPFGAMEVGMKEGPSIVPIGSVGTGYTVDEMHEIARRHLAKPGQVKVLIKSQGLTEGQQLWHARFVDFVEE